MLVAEELDVPLARVRLVPAGADRLYGNVATMLTGLPYFHPRETEPGQETTPAKAGQWVVAKIARELGVNLTGGSSSVVDSWDVLRVAAATARARLLGAARRSTSHASTTLDDPPVTLMPSSRAILATTHCPAFAGVVSWPGSVSRG